MIDRVNREFYSFEREEIVLEIDATGSTSGRVPFLPRHDASWAEHYVADEREAADRFA